MIKFLISQSWGVYLQSKVDYLFSNVSLFNLHILAPNIKHRLGAISFNVDGLHFSLDVKLLIDYFGIQVRGGCACAGTYGHYLLDINQEQSNSIIERLDKGELFVRPRWIRLSLHPTFTDADVNFITESIAFIAKNFE